MKNSKKELERAIGIIGSALDMRHATEILLVNDGILSTIKELTYRMFVDDIQQYFVQDDNVYDAISMIREYTIEMAKNGEVKFDVPFDQETILQIFRTMNGIT